MFSGAANCQWLSISDVPSIDAGRMEMLRELFSDGDPALFFEMLSTWENEAARRLREIQAAFSSADTRDLRSAAHALRGSCANAGVVRLSEFGRQLEREADNPPVARVIINAMEAEFQGVRETLSAAYAYVR